MHSQEESIYRHFKGGLYQIVCLSVHTETREPMITYKCLDTGGFFSRPLMMFFECIVSEGGDLKQRFTVLDN